MGDNQQQYGDFIDMRLSDPELEAWDGRYANVEPGFYDFEVEKSQIDQSKKGNPTLALGLKVVSDGPMKGRTMRQSYAILPDNDAARRRMKAVIQALGAPTDGEGRFSPSSLIGCRMNAEVTINTYEDVDPRNGQPIMKESRKLIGEQPCEGAAPQPKPASAPVASANGSARRPAATNGPAARRA